jgi:hypothetical protein
MLLYMRNDIFKLIIYFSQRFQREVTIWRELKHSNVVPLYGIVYIGEDVFSVSR